jgi:hypothetical protein
MIVSQQSLCEGRSVMLTQLAPAFAATTIFSKKKGFEHLLDRLGRIEEGNSHNGSTKDFLTQFF